MAELEQQLGSMQVGGVTQVQASWTEQDGGLALYSPTDS